MKPSDLADRRKAGLPLYDPSSLVVVGPEAVRRETPRASRSAKQTAEPAEQPRFVIASSVTPETIEWMWRGRLPRGKLVILDGDPGTGSSGVHRRGRNPPMALPVTPPASAAHRANPCSSN